MLWRIGDPATREWLVNSMFSTSARMLSLLVGLGMAAVFAHYLGAKGLGQYSLAVATGGLVFKMVGLGLHEILTREVAKDRHQASKYTSNAIGIRILVSLPLGLVLVAVFARLLSFRGTTFFVIILGALFVWASDLAALMYCLMRAVNRFRDELAFQVGYKVAALVACFGILWLGHGVFSVMTVLIVAQLSAGVIAYRWATREIAPIGIRFEPGFAREFIKMSLPLALAGTSEYFSLRGDSVLLGYFKGETAVGYYNAAYQLYLGLAMLLYGLAVAFYPTMSRSTSTSGAAARRLYLRGVGVAGGIGVLFGVGVFVTGGPAIRLLFGASFGQSVPALLILGAALPLTAVGRLSIVTLNSLDVQRLSFYAITLGFVANLSMNLVFIPRYSLLGASVTTVLTEATVLLVSSTWVVRELRRRRRGGDSEARGSQGVALGPEAQLREEATL